MTTAPKWQLLFDYIDGMRATPMSEHAKYAVRRFAEAAAKHEVTGKVVSWNGLSVEYSYEPGSKGKFGGRPEDDEEPYGPEIDILSVVVEDEDEFLEALEDAITANEDD